MTGTERKVFQKYYPPDFDPSKIPKAKGCRNRQFIQRVMAPFNMQCNTCNEYIYKGKKFNMRRETAEGEHYLGMKIFRFYFRCPNCLAEITFKTDMENVDYAAEHGATRLFDAFKTYQEQEREKEKQEEEEKADAMKMLEKRTKMSKVEMETLGNLEELQDMNRRNETVDALKHFEDEKKNQSLTIAEFLKKQEDLDEQEIRKIMSKTESGRIEKRITNDNSYNSFNSLNILSSNIYSKKLQKINSDLKFTNNVDNDGFVIPNNSKCSVSFAVHKPKILLQKNSEKKKLPKFMNGVIVKKKIL